MKKILIAQKILMLMQKISTQMSLFSVLESAISITLVAH